MNPVSVSQSQLLLQYLFALGILAAERDRAELDGAPGLDDGRQAVDGEPEIGPAQ